MDSHCSSFDYSVPASDAIKAGFNHIELVLNAYYLLPNRLGYPTREIMERLKTIRDTYDVTFSAHLPFWSVDASSHIEEIRLASLRTLIESVDAVAELVPTTFILHATGSLAADICGQKMEPEQKEACIRIFAKSSRLTVGQLVDHLSSVGIPPRRLALESIKFPFRHSLALADEFNTSVCIDVGHILAGYPGDVGLKEAFSLSKNRIAEVHVHDVLQNVKGARTTIRDHLPLGAGVLNLNKLLGYIASTGFNGPLVLEMKFEDALDSLKELKTTVTQPIRERDKQVKSKK
ncbi:MAG: cobamide remodeling phosphodiesterase CbiR [Nitrososphaeria archaeon]